MFINLIINIIVITINGYSMLDYSCNIFNFLLDNILFEKIKLNVLISLLKFFSLTNLLLDTIYLNDLFNLNTYVFFFILLGTNLFLQSFLFLRKLIEFSYKINLNFG